METRNGGLLDLLGNILRKILLENFFRKNLKIQWEMLLINEHMMIFGNKVFCNWNPKNNK
jgi:hypothetical protein